MASARRTSMGLGGAAIALLAVVGLGLTEPPVQSTAITVYKTPT